jgi:glucokinase
MKILLADIGGTNIRLGVADTAHDDCHLAAIESLRCEQFAGVEDALIGYCARHKLQPDALLLAVAAEMAGDIVTITNNDWQFAASAAARCCGAARYMVINDFCAQALAHCDLVLASSAAPHPSRHLLRSGLAKPMTPLLVSGPGTGLGVAAVLPCGDWVAVIEGEGGHVSFAARNDSEKQLLQDLQRRWGHVSAERLVSGPGLEEIYRFLTGQTGRLAPDIGAAALVSTGPDRDAVHFMMTAFATVLANAALSFGAGAGIVIAGGIIPKLAALLPTSGFFERLTDHGRRRPFLTDVPVYLSTDPLAGLRGAHNAAITQSLAHRWQTL